MLCVRMTSVFAIRNNWIAAVKKSAKKPPGHHVLLSRQLRHLIFQSAEHLIGHLADDQVILGTITP